MLPARMLAIVALAALPALAGCLPRGDAHRPIPLDVRPAARPPATTLVVILPGRRDDLGSLRRAGIADVFARRMPHAEVVLAEATLPYYFERTLTQRLHDEVVAPARARGIREVWLVGASLGGLGSVRHALDHPGDVDGLVLLAPYLGDAPLLREIAARGGLRAWDPGAPEPVTSDNVAAETWKALARWSRDPASAPQIFVAYGRDDPLAEAATLIAELVPRDRLLMRDGGHRWSVWTPAADEIARRIEAERRAR